MEASHTDMAHSGPPTAVATPKHEPLSIHKGEKGGATGVVLTATNTLDSTTGTAIDNTDPHAKDTDETPNTHEDGEVPELAKTSTVRKLALLMMFTLAEFLDAFNNSALFPAIPVITADLNFLASETVWIISAYQLTFAAFLLVSGRISDVYTPKPAFIAGCVILGGTHLIGGFVRQKIALLVLRALGGFGGALTIPSALSMIVQLFPQPSHQARAIALFGSAGAIGNILGLLIGAVLVEYAGWKWIFFFVAIVGIGIGAVCLVLIPNAKRDKGRTVEFDAFGVSLLTIAMILFIFAVTSGSPKGWGTAYVLAPLIISLFIFAAFLWWEARIDPDNAVLPPRMWRFRNFGVLVALALLPYLWFVTVFINLTSWWEVTFGWSAVKTAVHFLPLGVGAWLISIFTGQFPKWFPHKYIILTGLVFAIVATVLSPFGDSPDRYWNFTFPSFVIGTLGVMVIFANSSIAIFSYTPPAVAGTVGAVFNCALQLGSAVGLAAVSSISNSVDKKANQAILTPPVTEWSHQLGSITRQMWKEAFKGRAAAFWFILAVLGIEAIAVVVFFKVDLPTPDEKKEVGETEKRDIEASP